MRTTSTIKPLTKEVNWRLMLDRDQMAKRSDQFKLPPPFEALTVTLLARRSSKTRVVNVFLEYELDRSLPLGQVDFKLDVSKVGGDESECNGHDPGIAMEFDGSSPGDDDFDDGKKIAMNKIGLVKKDEIISVDLAMAVEIGLMTRTETMSDEDCLTSTMANLFDKARFADVTLQTRDGKRKIYASKIILAAKSSVIKEMFSSNLSETNLSEVTIKGMSYSTLRALVFFLYTGQCTISEIDTALDLLGAADLYQVVSLTKICEKFLVRNVTMSNAIIILIEGHLHNSETIKRKCFAFLQKVRGYVKNMHDLPGYDLIKSGSLREEVNSLFRRKLH